MNQATHAWLAVEAYRKVDNLAKTAEGKKKKLEGLAALLGQHLQDVVVAAWLPDCLIKDMQYGHVFKNAAYKRKDEIPRFTLSPEKLTSCLAADAVAPGTAFPFVAAEWWTSPYRVKDNGGHLPARVNALCQTARDMLKMGDEDVVTLTGIKPKNPALIADDLLYSPRDIAVTLWMASHYIADAHMPFHCDNRALASTSKQDTHGQVEDEWGKHVPEAFHSKTILDMDAAAILSAPLPNGSQFKNLSFGKAIGPLANKGDPWRECVYICRASFAVSFAWVPSRVAAVDDAATEVSLPDILNKKFCGKTRFWDISRAIMTDAVNAIARFWQDAWWDFVQGAKKS